MRLHFSHVFLCKIFTEISPRSRQDLGEILGEFLAAEILRSPRDLGADLAEISKSRRGDLTCKISRDFSGQDLGNIRYYIGILVILSFILPAKLNVMK